MLAGRLARSASGGTVFQAASRERTPSLSESRQRSQAPSSGPQPRLVLLGQQDQPALSVQNIKNLGQLRYIVEQTFALLHQFKRLAVRWERRTELHDAFVSLACSLICRRRLKKVRSSSKGQRLKAE
ncbi:hypothetical protein RKE30_21325 [Streptomyces sp. Li-HN-5-11]|uniref:transposase n=1 Tax=Streptomyces sp. Li-HN-5-11 TaxID=3075432 RepID=UPI0028AFCAD4|nr:transposase [Streptomyces sp. Li-HN-5-11]WNM32763.1 hypothetical protein RKE30_21325 [Streptomyces sp. Li-HN-5-11]